VTTACGAAGHPTDLSFQRLDNPARTLVRDGRGVAVAVLTDGARTVVFSGAGRTLAEPSTTGATVYTLAVVRLAPSAWHPGDERQAWFRRWFPQAMKSTAPDIIDIALQYAPGAPDVRDSAHLRVAGQAVFGPLEAGSRLESSDFNDYLGADWTFPDGTHRAAKPSHLGALDCSGFIRMVYGYRAGYPLEFAPPTGTALPRRAIMMAQDAPGVSLIPDTGQQITDLSALQAGDLVFFDADPSDGPVIDHVGIYLGVDSSGKHRFISSRKTANGPTMGDVGGASVLDGHGLYATGFRAARRL
jgi:hypothetical protein